VANNYALFSEKIYDLTDEEMDWLNKVLRTDTGDEEELPKLLELLGATELGDDDLDCCWPGFEYSLRRDQRSLWFYAEEGFSEEPLITVFQAFLRRFRPKFKICVSISYYCDKMRVGEFGGSWLFITANDVQSGSTWGELEKLAAKE